GRQPLSGNFGYPVKDNHGEFTTMSETAEIRTRGDAETYAAKMGYFFTPDEFAQATNLETQHRSELQAQAAAESPKTGISAFVEQFNRLYPKFLQTLLGIGDVLITMTQTILIAFGVPALLVMLMIVEQQRVDHGMALFEVTGPLAAFSATVLV